MISQKLVNFNSLLLTQLKLRKTIKIDLKRNQMKKLVMVIFLLKLCFLYSQNSEDIYPKGIYTTFESFINKQPDIQNSISAKQGNNIIITTFRIKDSLGNKIKDAFAVSDGKNLYVQTNAMLKHLTNSEFNKPNATNNDYSIAQLINNDYLYFEVFFQNKSVRMWGIGNVYLTGIIYKNSINKFTFLDTIKDLNSALEEKNSEDGEEESLRINGPNIAVARKAILKLFKIQ